MLKRLFLLSFVFTFVTKCSDQGKQISKKVIQNYIQGSLLCSKPFAKKIYMYSALRFKEQILKDDASKKRRDQDRKKALERQNQRSYKSGH